MSGGRLLLEVVVVWVLLHHCTGLIRDTWSLRAALHRKIFANYSKIIRPVSDQSQPVPVSVDLVLKQVLNVNIKNQILSMLMMVRMAWRDHHFSWDPEEYGGLRDVSLEQNLIWVPDVTVENAVVKFCYLSEVSAIKPRAFHGNLVLWFFPLKLTLFCKMDVTYFPYDKQFCRVVVLSWTMNGHQLNLTFFEKIRNDLDDHTLNFLDWRLTNAKRSSSSFPGENVFYPYLFFDYTFERDAAFFEYTMILPTVLIALTGTVVFFLPYDSGEKVALSVTVFLAVFVNWINISNFIPNSSDNFPIIGVLFFYEIVFLAASLLLTCVVSAVCSCTNDPCRVPRWVRAALFGPVATLLLVDTREVHHISSKLHIKRRMLRPLRRRWRKNSVKRGLRAAIETAAAVSTVSEGQDANQNEATTSTDESGSDSRDDAAAALMMLIRRVERYSISALEKAKTSYRRTQLETEWRTLALILDRVLAAFFISLLGITTASFLAKIRLEEQRSNFHS